VAQSTISGEPKQKSHCSPTMGGSFVGGSDAVPVIDDTAIPKKGMHLWGSLPNMLRRWARLRTASARYAPVMLALRLFLPESWASKRGRLNRADGPAEYGMARTKPEIALVKIDRGGQAGASPSAARRHSIDSGRRHQHSAGAQKDGEDQAIGRSKGGLSTKIHLMVDALDNPLACFLTGGQAHDLLATQEKPGADRT